MLPLYVLTTCTKTAWMQYRPPCLISKRAPNTTLADEQSTTIFMSAALTYHFTCFEKLDEQRLYNGNNPTSVFSVENAEKITMLLSNVLLSLVDRLNNLTHVSPTGRQLLAVPVSTSTSHVSRNSLL